MKIAQINTICGSGSTGNICIGISKALSQEGIENRIFYTSGKSDYPLGVKYASDKYIKLQALKSRIFGNYGFNSKGATKRLIKHLEEFKPDIIQLHNLHSHNVHLGMLFDYIRKNNIKTFWTFHDCWAFTGYCPHYAMTGCDKWKGGCDKCPQRSTYSWFFDKSKWLYESKKKISMGLDLTITGPSNWVVKQAKESFLSEYSAITIRNGIDLNVFKPTESDFREKYGLENKKIVLGVAFSWGKRKGLDVFLELSKRLPNDYQIVLVGTNDGVDKMLPSNIISIHKTANQKELAEIYTASDVFANPTREETFGLVNTESLACGTPVVTFRAGGSPECIDEKCGSVVEIDDIDSLEREIVRICQDKPFTKEACFAKAREFDKSLKFKEYVNLYIGD
ncbi:MAG: glycosyltransferase [Clostridia bacterium]|nr:glycosyltransferase [Clostridia bacterium]